MMAGTTTQGKLVEAGFAAFAAAQAPLSPEEILDLRIAFYAGAQHMFSSMVRAARSTDQVVSMKGIERELREFADECVLMGTPVAGNA